MSGYILAGLVTGGLYAISALALILTYKTSRVFNFAQGGEGLFIAYVYYKLVQEGLSPIEAALIAALVGGGILGFLLWFLLFRNLARTSPSVRLTVTIGLEVAIVAATLLIFGQAPVYDAVGLIGNHPVLHVLGVGISGEQLLVLGIALGIAVISPLILYRTHGGIVLRAVVDSPELVSGLGVNPNLVDATSWIVATIMVGWVGILLVPVLGLDSASFTTLIAASFAAAIVGRLSSFIGVFVAGLGLGVIGGILTGVLPSNNAFETGLPSSIPFVVIIVAALVYTALKMVPDEGEEIGQTMPPPTSKVDRLTGGRAAGSWDRFVGWGIAAAGLVAIPFVLSGLWVGVLAVSVCYGIIFLSWRLITAEAGIISLAQAAVAGLGAGVAAKVFAQHIPVLPAILAGAIFAAGIGAILGWMVLRLGPLYAALATFSFGLFVDGILFQTTTLNPAESGLPIGFPTIGSWVLQTPTELYVLALIVFGGVAVVLSRVRGSTSGMELAAIRSKSQRAASLGIRASRLRISSFVGAAFIAGIGGGMVASTQQVALPITYSTTSALVWFAVAMLMGIESIGGTLVAGLGIWLAPTLISAYLTPTWANALPVLFGVGAISIAKRGVGMVPHFRRLLRSLAARIEKRVGSQAVGERTPSLAGDGPLGGGGISEGAVGVGSSGQDRVVRHP